VRNKHRTRDGDSVSAFHQRCEGKANTLTIIKNSLGYVFEAVWADTALLHAVNFRVIVDDLDYSDHRPIACTVHLNSEAPDAALVESNRLHKFKWNNTDFFEAYADCLEELLERQIWMVIDAPEKRLEYFETNCKRG